MEGKSVRNNFSMELPYRLTSFVGREIEVAELKRLLGERRLVTLTGTGGAGKTRLALEAAAVLGEQFPDGIFMVELAPLAKPELVAETVSRMLGLEVAPNRTHVDALAGFLKYTRVLLMFDNCEHLVDECARLVRTLLVSCQDLCVLVTSREPLGVEGECLFRVPLLSLPAPDFLSDPERLADSEACRLFVDRARLSNPGFEITAGNAEAVAAVAQVCIQLDGIPLALELAAASLSALTIDQLAARLNRRFRLLTSGDRNALPRQQTLGALLDWSHTLLSPTEQVVFRRLALFPGDWTLDAADYLCAAGYNENAANNGSGTQKSRRGIAQDDVPGVLIRLVNKSLVQLDRQVGRYSLLETMRLYARIKLEEAGEQESVARLHLDWYLRFVENGSRCEGTSGQQEWFISLEAEHDNMRAALSWAISTQRFQEAARLALALQRFWIARAYHREALRWLEQVLLISPVTSTGITLKAQLLNALGYFAQEVKSFERSTLYFTEALTILRDLGDKGGVIASLLKLGWQRFVAADLEGAEQYAEEGLALARSTGDVRSTAVALNLLASARMAGGNLNGVQTAAAECLDMWRHLGDLTEVANALATYASAEHALRNLDHACLLLLEALRLHASLGTYTGLLAPIVTMLHFARESCGPPEKYIYLARVQGVLTVLDDKVGGKPSPWMELKKFSLSAESIAALGEEGFAREVAAGGKLSVDGIVALGEDIVKAVLAHLAVETSGGASAARGELQTVAGQAATLPTDRYPAGLTTREVEVLRVVAAGLTNQQAAEQLSVTSRTINAHLTSIYSKTGVAARAGAVRFALEHGLA
ncbi:MAG: LuxR C-terminal-related transcriptional regulator [Chloroflexota bacterium]|nr:LuxR C-terminal-related transcriptional regulator [Chloroflexota bacterium]